MKFKEKFYADNSAKYDEAIPNKINLILNDIQISNLKIDYLKMQAMMFGNSPNFEEIMEGLTNLQDEIHGIIQERI